ncbi:MAG: desulfoferrodoxin family protein [Betaproteobacteria bacterium]|nr:desulfoferrodoxin family protein [Betaproteobacteria bacterium]
MDRRHFIALSATAGAIALPGIARADAFPGPAPAAAAMKNLVFTAQDPGHWAMVKSLHVPLTAIRHGVLTITTPHPMTEPHYIVSHTVVLEGGKFLSRKTFSWHDKPISEHRLPVGYAGKAYVTSTCNLHDFWFKEISV